MWGDMSELVGKLNSEKNDLAVVISAPATIRDGEIVFDGKALSGIEEYSRHWGLGKVAGIFRMQRDLGSDYFVAVSDAETLEKLQVFEDEQGIAEALGKFDTILLAGDNFKDLEIFETIKGESKRIFFSIEYNLDTRFKIISLEKMSFPKKIKSFIWNMMIEHKRKKAFRECVGIQANGFPAKIAYQDLNRSMMMYFDTRTTTDMVATEQEMRERAARYHESKKVELVFSGRLESLKGASDLPKIAKALDDMQVDFRLHIFGQGSLSSQIADTIEALGLADRVEMHGGVDFKEELVPFIRKRADIFVCTHKQSDPSCTYLETFSCGVPIVGYSNEALDGLIGATEACWSVESGNVPMLARKIASLIASPETLADAAANALAFAKKHTFEHEYRRRVENLLPAGAAFGVRGDDNA